MSATANTPRPRFGPLIDWRASRIDDPVARLRFLRNVSTLPPELPEVLAIRRFAGWRRAVSVILWMAILIPAYTPSRARSPLGVQQPPVAVSANPVVWPVEKTKGYDLYSNGLRIENEFTVAGKPRTQYPVFRVKDSGRTPDQPVEWRTEPAGIVFHSTESMQAPFEPSEARMLRRIGRNLLDYIRLQHSYHFVIDRFGRVFRVVSEDGIANHSGRSVWSDSRGAYLNLNASFLSVAFEAQTDATMPLSAAQLHAARVLTDMLRSRFGIPVFDCVTHAQVSVNPQNWRIGYHTDWASGFPFSALGLPDNYAQPVPSITAFGFDYDDVFLSAAGSPWDGLTMARELVIGQARSGGLTTSAYREHLRERYRRIMSSTHVRSSEESRDESYQ